MATVKVRKVGNSLGVVLSKEVISRLGVESGDDLFLIETKNGFEITPYDPEFAKQVSVQLLESARCWFRVGSLDWLAR